MVGILPAVRVAPRLGLGHLVVFVVVALVLNAQFTWWVVHSLRDNQERLEMERQGVIAEARRAALELQLRAEVAARRLTEGSPGVIPSVEPPFVELEIVEARPGLHAGWVEEGGRIGFAWPQGRGRLAIAALDPLAPHRWLQAVSPSLHLVERGTPPAGGLPRVEIGPPLTRYAVSADAASWAGYLAASRRRVVLVVAEGVLFVAALVTAVSLLWLVLRREGARERQHENFVSAVTHELKTPIAGIRLALETILSGRVDDESRTRFLRNAVHDTERLADLVEKVLEVTRYTGGAHRLRIELDDLTQLVEDELAAAERRASALGTSLEADVANGVRAPFDAEAMSIVVSNLFENALKYAQGDPPWVRVRLTVERGEAVLAVEDNGVGIDPAELEAVFAPFYRSSDEVTRRTPGTGIGLFVAREIVAAHGGKLSASSRGRGTGAAFRLTLPGATIDAGDELSEYDDGNGAR